MAQERKDNDMEAYAGFQELLALRKVDDAVAIYWKLRENKIFRNLVVENLSDIRPEFRLYQINPDKLTNPDSRPHLLELKELSKEQKQEYDKKQERIRDAKNPPSFPSAPSGPMGTGLFASSNPEPSAPPPPSADVAPLAERKDDYQVVTRALMDLSDDPITPDQLEFIRSLQKFITDHEIKTALHHPDKTARVAKIEKLLLDKEFVELVKAHPVISKLFVANFVHDIDEAKNLFRSLKLREKAEAIVDRTSPAPGSLGKL